MLVLIVTVVSTVVNFCVAFDFDMLARCLQRVFDARCICVGVAVVGCHRSIKCYYSFDFFVSTNQVLRGSQISTETMLTQNEWL